MTLNAALWASSTALTGKAALAFWTAACLFQCCDQRKIALVWQILLSAGASLCSAVAGSQASNSSTMGLWLASAAVAGITALMKTRSWASIRPSEAFAETSQIDAVRKKRSNSAQATRVPAASWIALLGLLAASLAIGLSIYAAMPSSKSIAWQGATHALAASVLWGVGIFCAIELTFGSVPTSLAAVSWSGVAAVAIVCWIAEACIAAAIVLSPVDQAMDLQAVAIVRLFAISVLILDFVVWMIPQRLANFKRSGKATAWVSLTLAAWIGAISLAVLCALPSSWPWSRL